MADLLERDCTGTDDIEIDCRGRGRRSNRRLCSDPGNRWPWLGSGWQQWTTVVGRVATSWNEKCYGGKITNSIWDMFSLSHLTSQMEVFSRYLDI